MQHIYIYIYKLVFYYGDIKLELLLLKEKQNYKLLRNTNDDYETTKIQEKETN